MWEQQQREAALSWAALKKRIDAMLAARAAEAAAAPSPGAPPARAGAPRARALAPAAAAPSPGQRGGARRLGGGGPGGAAADEQLAKLYSALAAQKEAIAGGRQRLEALREDLDAYCLNNPGAGLPAALAPPPGALSGLR